LVNVRKLVVACLVGLLMAGTGLRADEDRQADHAALRELKTKVATAINQQDMKTLTSCFAKTFTFTTANQKTATTPEQVQALFDDLYRGPHAIIESLKTDPQADGPTRFIDTNTGIVQGSSQETYVLKGGKTVNVAVRWTATVVKEPDGWKVATAHVGLDPLENPILTAANAFWKKLCIGVALGGLLVGWLVGRSACCRRSAA
jgi:ketosteroid isomerase-like protein